ncbi:MAG: TonB-dependent receptor [Gemmatimonadota bacterium]
MIAGFVGFVSPATAQQTSASLTGRVADQEGAALSDVLVSLASEPGVAAIRTVLSDAAGVFRFAGIEPGGYSLTAQRLGFVPAEVDLSLAAGESRSVEILLSTDTLVLEGVVARARRQQDRERARFETDPGVTARVVEAADLRTLPGLAEPDILRAVQLLPGVISTSDFSSSYNVRGGSADQNLILLDGFTIFNPFHLGGLFSVFNSDAVERAELFAGGFGAEFGGRVSSVLNIESRSDVPEEVEFSGGVSLLASRLLVRAPLPDAIGTALGGEAGTFFISGRRSYFDKILKPIADFPYHLSDVQANVGIETANGGRLSFTGYLGRDVLDLSRFGLSDSGDAADALRLRWNWGNQVVGSRWLQPLGGGWVAETRLGYSRFAEKLSFLDFGDVRFESRMEQLLLRADLSRDFSNALSLRVGAAADRMEHRNLAMAGGTTFLDTTGDGVLGAGYASLRWRPSRWIVEPGIRLDHWTSHDATHSIASPRFAAKRFFGPEQDVALKFAVGRYSQFLHSLRDEELPVSNDTWVLADSSVPAVVSDQVQVGVESFWESGWSASAEAYARSFDGVTEFNPSQNPNDPSDDLLSGEGLSYGLDLQLRRSEGRLTGWTSLSLLRAERTFPDPLAAGFEDLPQTVSYAPIFDRRVNLDIVLQYLTAGAYEFGLRWNYGSGLPYTRPVAQHFAWRQNPVSGLAEPARDFEGDGDGDLPVAVVLGRRNAERYPSYHRLDMTVRREFERSWGTLVPYIQVLNLYNRRNVLFYFYDYDRLPPMRSGFSMFPFLPAVGVEVSF